jgi:hypothetical protein
MRRIRIYNHSQRMLINPEAFMVQVVSLLGGSLVLLLVALWWILHD